MPRQLPLSVALDGSTHTPAEPLTADHWAGLIGLAEQGALDFVTLDDSFARPPDHSPGRLDAVAVLARVAPVTSRIGLVPTVTTTHTEPFHTSTSLATLDFVSAGRAGWLVDVSATPAEARAVGRRLQAPAAELWAEAADAVEVATRLWDGWEDDAEIRDAATGRFIDRDRLHCLDFEGPHFSVHGPSIVPRPPQRRPPVAIALDVHDSDGQWELAASHADVVLLDADEPTTARLARTALLHRVTEAGRDPDTLRVLIRVAVDLGGGTGPGVGPGTPPPAEVRFTGSAGATVHPRAGHRADRPAVLHRLPGPGRRRDRRVRADRRRRRLLLVPHLTPGGLDEFVDRVVPLLQERGVFRTDMRARPCATTSNCRRHTQGGRSEPPMNLQSQEPRSEPVAVHA
ncbi:LLM class flavin-dependent oxidoreductase [Streptomyces sp. NPDC093598]|uniref:LLM class flavin-dependent oxidoreductase n=1 Tax=Streptomyces sp. NPDC093598 TaxID=3366046 RepID=UPI0038071933